MKTFDEALDSVLANPGMFGENCKSSVPERMSNERLVRLIYLTATSLASGVSAAKDNPEAAFAVICSRLHMIFDMGVFVGMEMEKGATGDGRRAS